MQTATSATSTTNASKREIRGWAMYDWANSAFSTTVGAVFLGPYLAGLADAAAKAAPDGVARFFGIPIAPDSFLPFAISLSVVFQAGLLPVLGAIADYSQRRKQLMRVFATIGAIATMLFFFVQGDLWWLGGVLYVIANLAFGASIVFYNAFLPDISAPDKRDSVSSYGWALGYLGGGLLLIVNLVIFLARDTFGLSTGLAVRINLASAGVWWLLWSFWTWGTLRPGGTPRALPPGKGILSVAFEQLGHTMETAPRTLAILLLSPLLIFVWAPLIAPTVLYLLRTLALPEQLAIMPLFLPMIGPIIALVNFLRRKARTLPNTSRFLASYLIYNDGIQTVIGVAATFAAAAYARGGIGMPTVRLTLLVLMIQFVAFLGSLFFGRLAGRLGTKRALVISLIVWAATVIYAYIGMQNTATVTVLPEALGGALSRAEAEFWVLGAVIALVLGGSQALSRSLFSTMIPKTQEAEFFSIYEISDRGTSWLGPFIFAIVNQVLGNLRPALLSVVLFFVVGLVLLFAVNTRRAAEEAAQAV